MANLKDIAQKLGVSVSTVSRGLNGGKEISREMTEKILKAADELGYTLQGRGGRATRRIGIRRASSSPRSRRNITRVWCTRRRIFLPRRAIRSS